MNADDLIELIKQTNKEYAQALDSGQISFETEIEKESMGFQFFLGRFADAILREEREECAKECDALEAYLKVKENRSATGEECANAIRSRNEEEEVEEESED